ncbi:hypothetical protein [Stappia sp. TSB10GB4]|uniref:hypothetical protein n=1 Tax=Stappia sp. TSB10GB4 TaxID=2003584 RepID=UPI001645E663|nr:hypothetical protein [Stappia sp. TSB10GB4]
MTYLPLRRVRALAIACPLLLAPPALAFDASGNEVADTFFQIIEAGKAAVTGYDRVEESGGKVTITGLRAALDDGGKTTRLTIAETSFQDAEVDADGGLTAGAMAMSGVTIEDQQDGNDVRVTAALIAIDDPVLPSAATIKAKADSDAMAPGYSRAEITGILIDTEKDGKIPIASVVAVVDEMDGDLPTAGSLTVKGIEITAASLDEDGRKSLTDLGYDKLVLGLALEAEWDPDAGVLDISDLTISGAEAATLNASLTLKGMTREVFAKLEAAQGNPEEAMGIMQGLEVVSLALRLDNESLVDRLLDAQAKESGASREEFVGQLSAALPMLLSVIGNPDFQQKVASAATTFLKDPQSISATAAPAAPVPFAQLLGAAMIAPQTLPNLLGVTIAANQD